MTTLFLLSLGIFLAWMLCRPKKVKSPPDRPLQQAVFKPEDKRTAEFKNQMAKITIDGKALYHSNEPDIIDVTDQGYKLSAEQQAKDYSQKDSVVPWEHIYVYSTNDLQRASKDQKAFYYHFKDKFLHQEYIKLNGFDNYAFVLLFDLLNDYKRNKNLQQLEVRFLELGKHYEKTNVYVLRELKAIMQQNNDMEGMDRIELMGPYALLGTKLKKTLGLTREQQLLVNRIGSYSNNFFDIPQCQQEIIKRFCSLFSETLPKQVDLTAKVIASKKYNIEEGTESHRYMTEQAKTDIINYLVKCCENELRQAYGHKRKLNTENPYEKDPLKTIFENNIIKPFGAALETQPIVTSILLETEEELNALNTTRWKIELKGIEEKYKQPAEFLQQVLLLAQRNKKNPSLELIYFEAAKMVVKTGKEQALSLYIHYVYADLLSETFDNRPLNKSHIKSLFKNQQQEIDFHSILVDLKSSRNIDKALADAVTIFQPKRKKIYIDASSIASVVSQHSETVDVLNAFLQDEEIAEPVNTPRLGATKGFSVDQEYVLTSFVKNNFVIEREELEEFARQKKLFCNQIIESINDRCYEELDDLLIEEEPEHYVMNQDYYDKIFAHAG